jgi:hypothetical protein
MADCIAHAGGAAAALLPFARLHLRWNPFGAAPPEDLGRLAVAELPELRPGDAVQFIGEAGRGKTTHLLALRARYPDAVYERIPPGASRHRSFLLDEAQRLRPRLLRRLLREISTVALGTHIDLSRIGRRPLATVRVGGLTPERLAAIVERRIEWARRGPGALPRVPAAAIDALIARFGDDLRAIEARLYEAFQVMEEPGDVQV